MWWMRRDERRTKKKGEKVSEEKTSAARQWIDCFSLALFIIQLETPSKLTGQRPREDEREPQGQSRGELDGEDHGERGKKAKDEGKKVVARAMREDGGKE